VGLELGGRGGRTGSEGFACQERFGATNVNRIGIPYIRIQWYEPYGHGLEELDFTCAALTVYPVVDVISGTK
jgi:hypothetical protein